MSSASIVERLMRVLCTLREQGIDGIIGRLIRRLKYGQNAHQMPAGLYVVDENDPLGLHKFELIEGAAPSATNMLDLDAALLVATRVRAALEKNSGEIGGLAVVELFGVGIKHNDPCGAAVGSNPLEVARNTVLGDPLAVFGGLVLLTFTVTAEVAEVLLSAGMPADQRRVLDAVVAPAFDSEAIEILSRKHGRCKLFVNSKLADLHHGDLAQGIRRMPVRSGFVAEPYPTFVPEVADSRWQATLSVRMPHWCWIDVLLAWAVGASSKSNTITIVGEGMLRGNAVGQQDRVGGATLAVALARRAGHKLDQCTAYSDSFFPFPDGLEVLWKAGVRSVFATSGSVRDGQVQEFAREHGVNLLQLPDATARGFWH